MACQEMGWRARDAVEIFGQVSCVMSGQCVTTHKNKYIRAATGKVSEGDP